MPHSEDLHLVWYLMRPKFQRAELSWDSAPAPAEPQNKFSDELKWAVDQLLS